MVQPELGSRQQAALYLRVSGDEQLKNGYSLPDQRAELYEYCQREGHEVVAEFEDGGYSGYFLERPNLDKLRDLVASGGVDVVVVSKRDRLARGYHARYLKKEFEKNGVRLVALNSHTDDSPVGQLTENILDDFAEFERDMIMDRMRRGKRRKAQEGKIVAGPSSDYGYRFNETRDGYEVDDEKMSVVRRIFEMVGAEGLTINAVARRFEAEGVRAPRGGKLWNRAFLRSCVLSDVYMPHSFEEVSAIVLPSVAARLDPAESYGIWWYGTQRHTTTREVRTNGSGEKSYPKVRKSVDVPKEEWIGVPVPDAGIHRELVLAARAAIKENRKCSNAGRCFWELTGSVLRCAECRIAMGTNHITGRNVRYYRCTRRYGRGVEACSMGKNFRADTTEAAVWDFVSSILKDPDRLRSGLDEMLAQEQATLGRNPGEEEKAWLKKLADTERQKDRLVDLYLDRKLDKKRYEAKASELDRVAQTGEAELDRLRNRQHRLAKLRRERDELLEHYENLVPESLDALTPEQRHRVYKIMGLSVFGCRDGSLEITWAYGGDHSRRSNDVTRPPGSARTPGR